MNQRNSDFNTFVLGLIVGGILGTLYAPQKGEETRKMLKNLIEEWSEKGGDLSEEVKQVFEEWKEKAEPAVTPIAQKIKERAIEQITPIIEEVAKKTAPVVEEIEPVDQETPSSTPLAPQTYQELQRIDRPRPSPKFFRGV